MDSNKSNERRSIMFRTLEFIEIALLIILVSASSMSAAVDAKHESIGNKYVCGKLRFGAQVDSDSSSGTGAYAGDSFGLDVLSYTIRITFDFETHSISGDCDFDAEVKSSEKDSVVMDLFDNMTVDRVSIGGEDVNFVHSGDKLRIPLPMEHYFGDQITGNIIYHGSPEFSGFGGFTWSTHQGVPLVSTISWPSNSPGWWPCHERLTDKALAEIFYTVPDTMIAVSNGKLMEVIDNGDGTKTFHWSVGYPIVTYLIMAAATNYVEITDEYPSGSGENLTIQHYVYPEDEGKARTDFSELNNMLACYESSYGNYPYQGEKFGYVEVPLGGGMEHQTIVSIGSTLIMGNEYYKYVFAHELAHQWWGDMVTIGTWEDIWLSEGFAVYSEAKYAEWTGGKQSYLDYMKSLIGHFPGTVYDPDDLLNNTVYQKGAWVLHMLRGVLGDETFSELLMEYGADPDFRFKNTTTFRFMDFVNDFSGKNMDWFFNEWVFSEGRPWYYVDFDSGNDTLNIIIEQLQNLGPVFRMPVDLKLSFTDGGDSTVSVIDSLERQEITLYPVKSVKNVTIDPEGWVLKKDLGRLSIETEDLPSGHVGSAYLVMLEASGGLPAYTWTLSSGSLPPGLTLNGASGMIIGYPEETGVYACSLTVDDSAPSPHTATEGFVISIDSSAVELETPSAFAAKLFDPAPNPMNPATLIKYKLPGKNGVNSICDFQIDIFDLSGRLIRHLTDGKSGPGEYAVNWDGRSDDGTRVTSGVYLIKLEILENGKKGIPLILTSKVVVLK